jgi:hypothetical protein
VWLVCFNDLSTLTRALIYFKQHKTQNSFDFIFFTELEKNSMMKKI